MMRDFFSVFRQGPRRLHPRRRCLYFGLGILLILTTTVNRVWLGVISERQRRGKTTFAAIQRAGGSFSLEEVGKTLAPRYAKAYVSSGWRDIVRGQSFDRIKCIVLGPKPLAAAELAGLKEYRELKEFHVTAPAQRATEESMIGDFHSVPAELRHLQRYQGISTGFDPLSRTGLIRHYSPSGTIIVGPGLVHLAQRQYQEGLTLNPAPFDDDDLQHLGGLPSLCGLNLSRTMITDRGLKNLAQLQSLESLDLSGTEITDEGLVHLANLPNLYWLNLTGTQVKGPGLAHLAALPSLGVLILIDTPVNDAELADVPIFPQLELASLAGSQVGDGGAAWLGRFPNLKAVQLDHTKITDAGAAALANGPSLASVTLSGCNVGNQGLLALANSSRAHLDLNDTLASNAGLDAAPRKVEQLLLSGPNVVNDGSERLPVQTDWGAYWRWNYAPRVNRLLRYPHWRTLGRIADSDSAESLWERAVMLWLCWLENEHPFSRSFCAFQSDNPRPFDAVFLAAITRSVNPAPIFVAWGDSNPHDAATRGAVDFVMQRLEGHPEEALLRQLLDSEKTQHSPERQWICYVAAVAADPDYAPGWQRLMQAAEFYYSDLKTPLAKAFVRHDPDNALSHYRLAIIMNNDWAVGRKADELMACLERGHAATHIKNYPVPLPRSRKWISSEQDVDGFEPDLGFWMIASTGRSFGDSCWLLTYNANSPLPRHAAQEENRRLRRSFATMFERLRDASASLYSTAFLGCNLISPFLISTERRPSPDNRLILTPKEEAATVKWDKARDHVNFSHRAFIRIRHFYADLEAAARSEYEKAATGLKDQGFDGSLEWLADIDQ